LIFGEKVAFLVLPDLDAACLGGGRGLLTNNGASDIEVFVVVVFSFLSCLRRRK